MKRGTEDLDFFIGDEALAAANGPGREAIQFDNDTMLILVQATGSTTQSDMDRLRTGYG